MAQGVGPEFKPQYCKKKKKQAKMLKSFFMNVHISMIHDSPKQKQPNVHKQMSGQPRQRHSLSMYWNIAWP
jgi:hypothetical protein